MAGWVRGCLAALVAGLVSMLAWAGIASAATIAVTSPTDTALSSPSATTCSPCSLREAVQVADNLGGASTITLPAGSYQLTIPSTSANDPSNGDLDIDHSAHVTIQGAGSSSAIIDANHVDRAFAVAPLAGLSLSGLTIENGQAATSSSGSQNGGAIYSDGALTVTADVTFTHNASASGGAIQADNDASSSLSLTGASFDHNTSPTGGAIDVRLASGTATIANSTFTANTTDTGSLHPGGAIYGAAGGSLTVTGSQFAGNQADVGGAIYWNTNTQVSISSSSFTSNVASSNLAGAGGGAIDDNQSAATTLTDDQFKSNRSAADGGALYLDAFNNTVYTADHDEFDGNGAAGSGGAVFALVGVISATDTSLVDNNAGSDGGGLYTKAGPSSPLTLVNVTASANSASKGGGLFLQAFTPVTMTNDTIAANTANPGQGGGIGLAENATDSATSGIRNTIIAGNGGGDCDTKFPAVVDSGHNLDGDSSCVGGLGGAGDEPGTNPLLDAPGANGGLVLTDAEGAGSPAIDTGTNTGCPATDARDVARPQGSACDIGAYEDVPQTLALRAAAPATVPAGSPYGYTLIVTPGGPGDSTNTTVTDSLPAGTTFYGATPSQGACTSSGSPVQVSCNLGTLPSGTTATVTITVAVSQPGSITDTATAANDQGVRTSASATTQVTPSAPAPSVGAPTAVTTGATGLTPTRATLLGRVTAGGQRTAFFFQYGSRRTYGEATPIQATSTAASVRAVISGLMAGHSYHYRLVAINSSAVAYGSDRTVTAPLPTATVGLAVRSARALRLPYRFTLAGTLRLPHGITRTRGCSGTVTVTVTVAVRKGSRRLTSRSVKVNRRCQYTVTVTIAKRPGKPASGRLSARAGFGGNRALGRSQSKRIGLRYGT